jgi:hypothetical protein
MQAGESADALEMSLLRRSVGIFRKTKPIYQTESAANGDLGKRIQSDF